MTVLLDPAHQPADDVATIAELAEAVRACDGPGRAGQPRGGAVAGADHARWGGRSPTRWARRTRRVADACDAVALVVAGQPAWLKPAAAAHRARRRTRPGRPDRAVRPSRPRPVEPTAERARRTRPTGPPPAAAGRADPHRPAAPAAADRRRHAPGPPRPWRCRWSPPGWSSSPAWNCRCPTSTPARRRSTGSPPWTCPEPDWACWSGWSSSPPPPRAPRPRAVDRGPGAAAARRPRRRRGGRGGARASRPGWPGRPAPAGARWPGWPPRAAPSLQVVRRAAVRADRARPGAGRRRGRVGAALRLAAGRARPPTAGVRLLVLGACGRRHRGRRRRGAGRDRGRGAGRPCSAGCSPPAARSTTPPGWSAAPRSATRCTAPAARPASAKDILAELGGGDMAVATGVLLGATARRVPVLLDGPVGLAAGMVSRDLAGQTRHWCLLADHGGHPAVRLAADVLGLTPLLDLRLDLGEGANALAALPLLRSVLALAGVAAGAPVSLASTTSRPATRPGPAHAGRRRHRHVSADDSDHHAPVTQRRPSPSATHRAAEPDVPNRRAGAGRPGPDHAPGPDAGPSAARPAGVPAESAARRRLPAGAHHVHHRAGTRRPGRPGHGAAPRWRSPRWSGRCSARYSARCCWAWPRSPHRLVAAGVTVGVARAGHPGAAPGRAGRHRGRARLVPAGFGGAGDHEEAGRGPVRGGRAGGRPPAPDGGPRRVGRTALAGGARGRGRRHRGRSARGHPGLPPGGAGGPSRRAGRAGRRHGRAGRAGRRHASPSRWRRCRPCRAARGRGRWPCSAALVVAHRAAPAPGTPLRRDHRRRARGRSWRWSPRWSTWAWCCPAERRRGRAG